MMLITGRGFGKTGVTRQFAQELDGTMAPLPRGSVHCYDDMMSRRRVWTYVPPGGPPRRYLMDFAAMCDAPSYGAVIEAVAFGLGIPAEWLIEIYRYGNACGLIYPSPASRAYHPNCRSYDVPLRGDARKASWDEWLAKSAAIIEEVQRRRG